MSIRDYLFVGLMLAPAFACVGEASAAAAAGAVAHASVYTAEPSRQLPSELVPARPAMPHLDPRSTPPSRFLRGNALPEGKSAPSAGAIAGSNDGQRRSAEPDLRKPTPDAFGNSSPLSIAPYTMARASASTLGLTTLASEVGVTSAPWRATGALYFKNGGSNEACSASMISPGLLVTAAHCVYNFGTKTNAGFHTDFKFYPALYGNAVPPYGIWTATTEYIASTYYNGTDTCLNRGVSCNNDIAIIVMARNALGQLPGNVVGWYGYGWEGYSFTKSFGGASLASITQLGYPVAFDKGYMMERNDGIGAYYKTGNLKNTVLGSPMTGGASGGPWIVNFGTVPSIVAPATTGSQPTMSVVGVTSWDYTSSGSQLMGSSWFGATVEFPKASYADSHKVNRGSGKIGFLVSQACTAYFDHC